MIIQLYINILLSWLVSFISWSSLLLFCFLVSVSHFLCHVHIFVYFNENTCSFLQLNVCDYIFIFSIWNLYIDIISIFFSATYTSLLSCVAIIKSLVVWTWPKVPPITHMLKYVPGSFWSCCRNGGQVWCWKHHSQMSQRSRKYWHQHHICFNVINRTTLTSASSYEWSLYFNYKVSINTSFIIL